MRPGAVVVEALHGAVPAALLFSPDPDRVPAPREPGRRRPAAERFETLSWTSDRPVSLPRLQAAIEPAGAAVGAGEGVVRDGGATGAADGVSVRRGAGDVGAGRGGCGGAAAGTDCVHCRDRGFVGGGDRHANGRRRRSSIVMRRIGPIGRMPRAIMRTSDDGRRRLRRRPNISEPVLNSVIPAKAGTQPPAMSNIRMIARHPRESGDPGGLGPRFRGDDVECCLNAK